MRYNYKCIILSGLLLIVTELTQSHSALIELNANVSTIHLTELLIYSLLL